MNAYGDSSLAIQYLGDFMRYEPEEKQFEAMIFLLNYGKTEKYLSNDYKIFGLNQTKLSKFSPGVNVMKRLRNLPRYSFCGEEGFEPCGKDINIEWNFKKNPKWHGNFPKKNPWQINSCDAMNEIFIRTSLDYFRNLNHRVG